MKSLIVNADDVGLTDAINEAAKDCYLNGAITHIISSRIAATQPDPQPVEELLSKNKWNI